MKTFSTLILLLGIVLMLPAQQTITASIQHDGLERDYILYVPAAYSPDEAVPLVLNFHGYTSNATEQMFYGDFRPLANVHNFLVVHPQGTEDDNGTTHWNVGWGGSTVDDVGFTAALLDTLQAAYNINPDRIYSTGMSNGGFMSYQLACEMSDRIAAIASVTGTMNPGQPEACQANRPVPVMEIHGTADATVPYDGGVFLGTEAVIDFWVEFNGCSPTAMITDIEDTNPSDDSTVEWRQYGDCDDGVAVELFKVLDGRHTWPGSAFAFPGTNYDINASQEIWRFFSQYDINGLIETTNVEELAAPLTVDLFPNPTADVLNVRSSLDDNRNYRIINAVGQELQYGRLNNGVANLDVAGLPTGLYWLVVGQEQHKFIKR